MSIYIHGPTSSHDETSRPLTLNTESKKGDATVPAAAGYILQWPIKGK